MILVDTSGWIEFFKDRSPVAEIVDKALDDNQIAMCGPVLTELLRGFKSERERRKIVPLFTACRLLAQPADLWETAGHCGYVLKRKDATVKSIGLLIACFAIAHNTPILTLDKDFHMIRSANFGLELIDF